MLYRENLIVFFFKDTYETYKYSVGKFEEFLTLRLVIYYDYVFSLYVYVWLPWLRFFRAFSSVVSQMLG